MLSLFLFDETLVSRVLDFFLGFISLPVFLRFGGILEKLNLVIYKMKVNIE